MPRRIEKVLLIYPPSRIAREGLKFCFMPLGISYLAASIRREFDVAVLDATAEGYDHHEDDTHGFFRFGLPMVGIVGNDAALGQMLRPEFGLYGADRKVAVDLAETRYDRVVEALGGHGEYCRRPEEIRPALERAFASGRPALVNVMIRKDEGAPKGSTYV